MARQGPFTVKAVAKVLGVSPNTIRAWETRYGAVSPVRSETNRRLYTADHVERLKLILQLINYGHSVGAIASLPEKKLLQLAKETRGQETVVSSDATKVAPLIESLGRFDFPSVAEKLDRFRLSNSTRDYVLGILSPLLGEVGRLVADGNLSIAQEHALSAIIRDQIGQTMQSLRRDSAKSGPSFLFATPEGDLHEFGILLSATLCAHYGFRAVYLGPNLPAEALTIAAEALKPDVVVLGNSPSSIPGSPSFESYLKFLSTHLKPKAQIWIGGQGQIPHLRAVFGKRNYEALASLADFDSKIGRLKWRGRLSNE